MEKQSELDDQIVRSGARFRESVRSLPKGHFQQIRQMFDKQPNLQKKLSTIYERPQKSISSNLLLRLPVTDDEKLKHVTKNMDDGPRENSPSLEERYRNYLSEYQTFRLRLSNEFLENKATYPSKYNESQFKQSIILPQENHLAEGKTLVFFFLK